MPSPSPHPRIRYERSRREDLKPLELIRTSAFQAIFASFQSILGDTIYELAQRPEDEAQKEMLPSLLAQDSEWEMWNLIFEQKIAGFIAIKIDTDSLVGEIGLNAIDPDFAGQGLGSHMYQFAVQKMKEAGMKVATVATGGDPAHLPARKAYRKAGFNVEIPSLWMCQEL